MMTRTTSTQPHSSNIVSHDCAILRCLCFVVTIGMAILPTFLPHAHCQQPTENCCETFPVQDQTPVIDDAERLMRVFESILENHIQSPTLQQMVLDTILELQGNRPGTNRRKLVSEVSSLTDRGKLVDLIRRAHAESEVAVELNSLKLLTAMGVTVQPTKEANVESQLAANRYVGIGVSISKSGQQPAQFMAIVPGGTAESAGIVAGDQLLEADGKSMIDLPLNEVIDVLRGPEGSELTIKIRSAGGGDERHVTMIRKVVPFKTVKSPIFSKSGKSAIISIDRISASSVHELRQAAADLDDAVELVALSCSGQFSFVDLHHAVLLAGALLGEAKIGPIIKNDGTQLDFKLTGEPIFGDRHLRIVLSDPWNSVWTWIASANRFARAAPDSIDLSALQSIYSTLEHRIGKQVTNESFAFHYQSIAIAETGWSASIPVGLFCDPEGKVLNPYLTFHSAWQPGPQSNRSRFSMNSDGGYSQSLALESKDRAILKGPLDGRVVDALDDLLETIKASAVDETKTNEVSDR